MKFGSHDRLRLNPYGWRENETERTKRQAERKAEKKRKATKKQRFAKLCERYGRRPGTIAERIKSKPDGSPGMTLREALRTPVRRGPNAGQQHWNYSKWRRDRSKR